MAQYAGRTWRRGDLMAHVGSMAQLAGIDPIELADGQGRGLRGYDVNVGAGLRFRVLADRALDIAAISYRGLSLAWASPNGEAHPAYYEPAGMGWLRTYQGGLFVTCGLDQFGAPNEDNGEAFGLHGRVSALPASQVSHRAFWVGDEYELEITGQVRQARIYGENLVLQRRISARLGENRIRVADSVTNEGFAPQPHMLLYHCNLGFPLIGPETRLTLDVCSTEPRDAEAAAGLATWRHLQAPTAGYAAQVFHHQLVADAQGVATVTVENPAAGLGLRIRYDAGALPHLFQWKMLAQGAYVLGIEPGNCSGIEGRATARSRGDLPHLAPGETRNYWLEFEVL